MKLAMAQVKEIMRERSGDSAPEKATWSIDCRSIDEFRFVEELKIFVESGDSTAEGSEIQQFLVKRDQIKGVSSRWRRLELAVLGEKANTAALIE